MEVLILYETDMLLDMGFEAAQSSITRRLPRMKGTALLSATRVIEGILGVVGKAGMKILMTIEINSFPSRSWRGRRNTPPPAISAEEKKEEEGSKG